MEQERFAPQRVIGRIKLTEPKCSWQQLGGESLGSGCDKSREWRCMCPGFDVIKKKTCGVFLRGPKAIYETERRTCHVQDAWSWKRGHTAHYLSPTWVRTDKKDIFLICYICSKSMEAWESVKGRKKR